MHYYINMSWGTQPLPLFALSGYSPSMFMPARRSITRLCLFNKYSFVNNAYLADSNAPCSTVGPWNILQMILYTDKRINTSAAFSSYAYCNVLCRSLVINQIYFIFKMCFCIDNNFHATLFKRWQYIFVPSDVEMDLVLAINNVTKNGREYIAFWSKYDQELFIYVRPWVDYD